MKMLRSCLLIFCFLALTTPAFALTPPLSPDQLKKQSDLVVEAIAQTPIHCQGLVRSYICSDVYRYEIPLKINKVIKGIAAHPGETITVTYIRYDYSKAHCVGDQGPLILPGEVGTFYLKQGEGASFESFHWSAVQSTKNGTGELPACPKNK